MKEEDYLIGLLSNFSSMMKTLLICICGVIIVGCSQEESKDPYLEAAVRDCVWSASWSFTDSHGEIPIPGWKNLRVSNETEELQYFVFIPNWNLEGAVLPTSPAKGGDQRPLFELLPGSAKELRFGGPLFEQGGILYLLSAQDGQALEPRNVWQVVLMPSMKLVLSSKQLKGSGSLPIIYNGEALEVEEK